LQQAIPYAAPEHQRMKLNQKHCKQCGCLRMALAPSPNHAFWLLLSIVTAGAGAIGWIIAVLPSLREWRCATCGSLDVANPDDTTIPRDPPRSDES
jgi:hypothetical protein